MCVDKRDAFGHKTMLCVCGNTRHSALAIVRSIRKIQKSHISKGKLIKGKRKGKVNRILTSGVGLRDLFDFEV